MGRDRFATVPLWLAAGSAALLLLFGSEPLMQFAMVSASEYPTWVLIPVAGILVFQGRNRLLLAAAALGLSVLIRPNLGIAAIFLLGWACALPRRHSRPVITGAVAIFAFLLLLPALHNYHYGGEWVFMPTGASTVMNLPPEDLPKAFTEWEVARTLIRQAVGTAYLEPDVARDEQLGLAILMLQVLLLVTAGRWISRRVRQKHGWWGAALLAWPVTFWVPAVVFDIWIYYPRHIIAGYVASAVVVIMLERWASNAVAITAPPASPSGGGAGCTSPCSCADARSLPPSV